MSRKNFIITALLINLTICITLCIVVFTDKKDEEVAGTKETSSDEVVMDSSKEMSSDEVEMDSSKETSSDEVLMDNSKETSSDKVELKTETSEIVESQVQSDTPPVTYIDYNGITLNNQETTTLDYQEETTTPQETTITVTGTTATITQSCNIRSQADMSSSSRIGTAILGANYRIEPTLCSSNWTAIYLEDNTVGYVSASFCVIS